jgi:hypothetical protein
LYTFHKKAASSSELRSIKYSIEKSNGMDLVQFLQRVKTMVARVESIPVDELIMDQVSVTVKNLMQVMSSIYGKGVVKKTHLLTLIQARSKDSAIVAAEICAILVVDFVKCRDKALQMTADDLDELNATHNQSFKKKKKEQEKFKPEDPHQVSFLKSQAASPSKSKQQTQKTKDTYLSSIKQDVRNRSSTPQKATQTSKSVTTMRKLMESPSKYDQNPPKPEGQPDWVGPIFPNRPDRSVEAEKSRYLSPILKRTLENKPPQPVKKSVFLEELENRDPQAPKKDNEHIFYLEEPHKGHSESEKKRAKRLDPTKEKKILV